MKTEHGAVFLDREQDSRRSSERAVAATERAEAPRDPIAALHSGFRRRARGEETEPSEGEQE